MGYKIHVTKHADELLDDIIYHLLYSFSMDLSNVFGKKVGDSNKKIRKPYIYWLKDSERL